jgi:hypothetical protein
MISDRSYREILGDLRKFESYLTSLRVESPRRLAEIISNIEAIDRACSNGRAAARAFQTEATEPRFRELVWSLVEGAEWAESFRGLHSYDPIITRRLMRIAMIGPPDPKLEDNSTNVGRNTTFELRLGEIKSVGQPRQDGWRCGPLHRPQRVSSLYRVQATAKGAECAQAQRGSLCSASRAFQRLFAS